MSDFVDPFLEKIEDIIELLGDDLDSLDLESGWPLLARAAVAWKSEETLKKWLDRFLVQFFSQIKDCDNFLATFSSIIRENKKVRLRHLQNLLESTLLFLDEVVLTIEEEDESATFDTYVNQFGGIEGAKIHAEATLRARYRSSFLKLEDLCPGCILFRYRIPLPVFFSLGRDTSKFEIKNVEFPPELTFAWLGIESSSGREKRLERLASYTSSKDKRAEMESGLYRRQSTKHLQELGIIEEYATRMVHVDAFDHTLPQLVVMYLSRAPRDKESIRKMCSTDLQRALDDFFDAFPNNIDANLWLTEYLLNSLWISQTPVLPRDLKPGSHFELKELESVGESDSPYRAPVSGILLNEKRALLDSIEFVASKLKIEETPSAGKERWFHGTCQTAADSILEIGIDLSKAIPGRDFGPAFYVGQDYKEAVQHAFKNHPGQIPAVVIFDVETAKLEALSNLRFPFPDAAWAHHVFHWRSQHRRPKETKEADKKEWIRGPMASFVASDAKNKSWNPKPYDDPPHNMQLAIKHVSAAELLTCSIVGIALFARSDEQLLAATRNKGNSKTKQNRVTSSVPPAKKGPSMGLQNLSDENLYPSFDLELDGSDDAHTTPASDSDGNSSIPDFVRRDDADEDPDVGAPQVPRI